MSHHSAVLDILRREKALWWDACSAFKGLTSPEWGAPTAHRIGLIKDAAAKMAEHAERVVVAMRDLQVAARLDTAQRLEKGDGNG